MNFQKQLIKLSIIFPILFHTILYICMDEIAIAIFAIFRAPIYLIFAEENLAV